MRPVGPHCSDTCICVWGRRERETLSVSAYLKSESTAGLHFCMEWQLLYISSKQSRSRDSPQSGSQHWRRDDVWTDHICSGGTLVLIYHALHVNKNNDHRSTCHLRPNSITNLPESTRSTRSTRSTLRALVKRLIKYKRQCRSVQECGAVSGTCHLLSTTWANTHQCVCKRNSLF